MERSREILHLINVPTNELTVDTIQALMVLVKEDARTNLGKELWDEIAQKLWCHLSQCLEKLDDQLLGATCFYSVIMLADKEDNYLDKLLHILGPDPSSLSQAIRKNNKGSGYIESELSTNMAEKEQCTSTLHIMSMMYGMFQSSFLISIEKRNHNAPKISAVLKETFDLLLLMAYEYSQYTFLVFKTIKSFKKLCGGSLESSIFNIENCDKMLALVNNNWENPVTGIRDMNRCIFQTVISTLDDETYQKVLQDIDGFYWNKAKFLMLSEVIESYRGDIMSLVCGHDKWIDGLVYSLHKPGLVSAGADMYYALLKKINTQDNWCQLFLCHILNILNGTSDKAVEHFSNYWCLTTMKKFGALTPVLVNELEKLEDSEQLLYSKLCVMKQANKLGVIDKNWNLITYTPVQKAVLIGIEHCNNHIRMLAFDIVCVSQRKSIPSQTEYDLILNFLHNNVNSDNTVLRLSMFSSFNSFLIQLHSSFLNVMIKNDTGEALDNLLLFSKRLQNLIVDNFKINGNYQRKITSVKLCNYILTYFSEIPKKRKDQTRQANITIIAYLKQKACWLLSTEDFIMNLICLLKDPADDVRESVIKMLLSHYGSELRNETIMTNIIKEAKLSMASKFFYEISCGQSMFKLITNLLIQEEGAICAEFKTVENIVDFAYNELITQHAAKSNIMESIETGKQLHSYMSILLVILEECKMKSYKINIHNGMSEFLDVLESISNQFAWEEEGSSDFSKMNDMVQSIIESYSDYSSINKDDNTKISGLQQIVLNCLWLSVKGSCDLASILIQYNENNIEMCEKCLNIITRVLETSRHKGAIEAAGAALGRAIQYLTSLPDKKGSKAEEIDVTKLPFILLKRKLNDLISETNKMSSITRRGAGLSIMVHRIVSSDMKKGKPLFHYFIKNLLQICKNKEHAASSYPTSTQDENIENQVDLPKAIYIHFMTRIVTDSSLATDMMYYSVDLAELAFGNLTSDHWQIRNAALQLYGALVPRLIGQKKASGTDDETIATVACDEMRTHLPKLWQYITEQLKQYDGLDTIQTHSNLLPILNMLANSAKRYNFSLHEKQNIEYYNLFSHLILLLGSPIYTVRRLTARTIFNIYEFETITNAILNQENITENLLHGLLLLLNLCYKYYNSGPNFENNFSKLRDRFCEIFMKGTHSYLCKKLYEDIYVNYIDMKDVENTILEMTDNVSPGVQIWVEARLKKYINKCSWSDIPNLINKLLQLCDYEMHCEIVFLKIQTEHNIPNDVLIKFAEIMTTFDKQYSSCVIWKMLYYVSLKINLSLYINIEELLNIIERENVYNLRYMVALIARHIDNASYDNQSRLIKVISNLSDFENVDVDLRLIAAIANNEVAHNFKKLPDTLKVISINCAALLLQDEDEDIRNTSVKFYSTLSKDSELKPYISLNKILDKNFLQTVFDDPQISIQELVTKLSAVFNLNHNIDSYNPFANDSKNIYFEPALFEQIVHNLVVN